LQLAFSYRDGTSGVLKDRARATALFQSACQGGEPKGCTGVGFMYHEGLGVVQDFAVAARAYEKGCDGGDPEGCVGFAICVHDGTGVAADADRALRLVQVPCFEQHNQPACDLVNAWTTKSR
jgi:TPR repeat protein